MGAMKYMDLQDGDVRVAWRGGLLHRAGHPADGWVAARMTRSYRRVAWVAFSLLLWPWYTAAVEYFDLIPGWRAYQWRAHNAVLHGAWTCHGRDCGLLPLTVAWLGLAGVCCLLVGRLARGHE